MRPRIRHHVGEYAEFIQTEVLPQVEKETGVTLTKDPDGRSTMGGSSGGIAAFTMAWYHPEWFRCVLIYSGNFRESTVAIEPGDAPRRLGISRQHHRQDTTVPIRIWMEVGENDKR